MVDYARLAAAHRARRHTPKAPAVPPVLYPAQSRDECAICGVPGFKGCAHQLPFEPIDPTHLKASPASDGRSRPNGAYRRMDRS